MQEAYLQQIQTESFSWKIVIGSMIDENIRLKNKLAEILNKNFNKTNLEEAERFQSLFLMEDEVIGWLRNDVADIEKLLDPDFFEDSRLTQHVDVQLKNIRNNLKNAEIQFAKLKADFRNFLSEINYWSLSKSATG